MRTITELASLPTNSDGTKQERVGITKLFNAIESGRFVEHLDDSITLDNVTYRPNVKAALTFVLANRFDDMADMLRLFEADYAMPIQQEAATIAAKAGNKKTATKPLEGHVLTSTQWLQCCIDKLPPIPEPDYEGHAVLVDTISDGMTKAQILEIVFQAKALVKVKTYSIGDCTQEQQAKYNDLVKKETAIAEATSVLSVYLDDIKPISDTAIQGRFNPLLGTGALFGKLLTEEGYKILASTDVHAKVVNFIPVEPGYILFSIQVVTI